MCWSHSRQSERCQSAFAFNLANSHQPAQSSASRANTKRPIINVNTRGRKSVGASIIRNNDAAFATTECFKAFATRQSSRTSSVFAPQCNLFSSHAVKHSGPWKSCEIVINAYPYIKMCCMVLHLEMVVCSIKLLRAPPPPVSLQVLPL